MPSHPTLSSENGNWQTPPSLVSLVVKFNRDDPIGLDPCGAPNNPCNAKTNWFPPVDGLDRKWAGNGLVFVNPPYQDMKLWAEACSLHGLAGAEVLLLCPPRTDTKWFRHVWTATAIAFWHGSGEPHSQLGGSRLRFVDPATGEPMAGNTSPSVIAYWGARVVDLANVFGHYAKVVRP